MADEDLKILNIYFDGVAEPNKFKVSADVIGKFISAYNRWISSDSPREVFVISHDIGGIHGLSESHIALHKIYMWQIGGLASHGARPAGAIP